MTDRLMESDILLQPNKWATIVELTIFSAFVIVVHYLIPASFTLGLVIVPIRVPFLFLFGWISLRRRNISWRSLGLQTSQNWRNIVLLGVGLGVGLQMLNIIVIGPIIRQITGVGQNLQLFSNMANGNSIALLGWLAVTWTLAAFGEEMVYRGYLMNRINDLTGSTAIGWAISVISSSLLFGAVHAYQGVNGIILATITGLIQGMVYLGTRRNLWVAIICHGTIDTLGFTLIYVLLQCCVEVLK